MTRTKALPTSRCPGWLNAAALLVASFIAIAALSMQVRPGAEVVAVAFPPWWSARQVLLAAASANAAIVRMTAIPSLLVVRPDDQDGLVRLRSAGAWLTMDPQAIAACFAK
jgi:phosphoglycerol transferase MdoB-like AlkP superfamily enzyme